MDNIKKNPVLMGILNCLGCAAIVAVILFILSLVDSKESFAEKIGDPVMIVFLVVAALVGGIQSYLRTRKANEGEKK